MCALVFCWVLRCLPRVPSGLYLRWRWPLRLRLQFKSCKSSVCRTTLFLHCHPTAVYCYAISVMSGSMLILSSSSSHPQPSEYSWYSSGASSTRSSPVVSTLKPLPVCMRAPKNLLLTASSSPPLTVSGKHFWQTLCDKCVNSSVQAEKL